MDSVLHMRFEKFKPEKEEKKLLKFTREKLEEHLPSGSISNVSIRKEHSKFEAALRIQTKRGIFYIKAKAEDLMALNAQLQSKLKRRIRKYKEIKIFRPRKKTKTKAPFGG